MFGKSQIHLDKAVDALSHKKDNFEIKNHYRHDPKHSPDHDIHLLSIQAKNKRDSLILFHNDLPVLADQTELVVSDNTIIKNIFSKALHNFNDDFRLYIRQTDKNRLVFQLANFDTFKKNNLGCAELAVIIVDYMYDTLQPNFNLNKKQLMHYLEPLFNQRFQYQALKNKLYDVNEAPVPIGNVDPKVDTALFDNDFNYRNYAYQHQEEVSTMSASQLATYITKVWDSYCHFVTGLLTDLNYDLLIPMKTLVKDNQTELFERYLFDLYEKILTKQNHLSISKLQKPIIF